MADDVNNGVEEEINTNSENEGSGRFNEDLKKLEKEQQLREEVQCFGNLIEALKKVNALTNVLCTKKNSTYPPLTKKSHAELKAAYLEAGVLCTRFLESGAAGNQGMSKVTDIVRQIETNLRSDLDAIDLYERISVPVTMPLLLEYSRTDIIDLGNDDLGKVGANLSSRIPFGYVNPDGSEVKGVFTRKKYFDTKKIYQDKCDELGNTYPELKEYLGDLLEGYNKQLEKEARKPRKDDLPYSFCFELAKINHDCGGNLRAQVRETAAFVDMCLRNAGKDELAEKYRKSLRIRTAEGKAPVIQATLEFSKEMEKLAGSAYGVVLSGAAIKNGSRIDSRNTGMSIVADMLGVSKVIARSRPMTIRYKGETIEGTFMELGRGREFDDPSDAAVSYGEDFFENRNLGSVSDLLVLDFICGNVDRHAGNVLYQFGNERDRDWTKHVWLGVQGIDNDACLGEYVPKSVLENNVRMASISSIKAIKTSTAKAVLAMKPEMLKFRLRGLELSDQQIECACERLKFLQNSIEAADMTKDMQKRLMAHTEKGTYALKMNKIRVIPDEKFGLLTLDQLRPMSGNNVYDYLNKYRQEMEPVIKGRYPRKAPLVPRTVNSMFGYVIRTGERKSIDKMLEKLAEVTDKNSKGEFKRTSEQFEALRASVKNFAAFNRDHENQLMTPADYDIRTAFMKQVMDRAQAYLDYKGEGSHRDYTQRRVDAVRELLQQMTDVYGMTDRDLYRNMMKKPEEQLTAAEKTYRMEMHKYDERNIELLNARLRAEANRIAEQAAGKAPGKAAEGNAPAVR